MRSLSFPAYAAILCCLGAGCGIDLRHGKSPGSLDGHDAMTGGIDEDDGGVEPTDPGGPTPTLPIAKGTCPTFADGMMTFGTRSVRVWMDASAAAAKDGPLVFYWYGTGGQPAQAQQAIDIAMITSAGGIVVAPVHANTGTFPWIITGGTTDYELADEIVACAEQDIGIDDRHVHSHGFSAGGLFSAQFSFARSNYLASVATYSGGGAGEPAAPDNKFAALVIYGGPEDQYMGILNFSMSSTDYADDLKSSDHYVVMCNHGGKHSIPKTGETASLSSAFFLAHGYGTRSPWGVTPPSYAPSYCSVY